MGTNEQVRASQNFTARWARQGKRPGDKAPEQHVSGLGNTSHLHKSLVSSAADAKAGPWRSRLCLCILEFLLLLTLSERLWVGAPNIVLKAVVVETSWLGLWLLPTRSPPSSQPACSTSFCCSAHSDVSWCHPSPHSHRGKRLRRFLGWRCHCFDSVPDRGGAEWQNALRE